MYQDVIDKITDNIFISGIYPATHAHHLSSNNIRYVLRVTDTPITDEEKKLYDKMGIDYFHIPMIDSTQFNIKKYFSITNNIIKRKSTAGHNILIHCTAGISRSATIIAAYLLFMEYEARRKSPSSYKTSTCPNAIGAPDIFSLNIYIILQRMKTKRRHINPNYGFIQQLREYEHDLTQDLKQERLWVPLNGA